MDLKVCTLCSGYDSQMLALRRLQEEGIIDNLELVAWSEFDPESKQPLDKQPAVVAHNALFPEYKDRNLGDMTKVDWTKVPDFDLLTYSTPCFVAGTLVLTEDGYKPIEEVREGDKVLTHTNTLKEVLEVGKKPADEIIKVRSMMFDEVVCTPNHPFYTREMYRYGHKRERLFKDPVWKAASELTKKDYLGFAVNTKEELPVWEGVTLHRGNHWDAVNELSAYLDNEDFWYLMGRYIGDGWQRNDKTHKGILIACADKDRDALESTLNNLGWKYTYTQEKTCGRITIYGKELCEFVNRYGKYAYGKCIDAETLNLPVNLLKAFLNGYLASDGCIANTEYRITTVSRELAYGLMQAIAKCYHRPSRLYKVSRPSKYIIDGREVNQRDTYTVLWHTDERKQDKAFYEDGICWFPIKGISATNRKEFVYNMEVEEDHSYTANGAIVHNCQSISNAGLQKGITEGSGTRSSVLWSTRYAIMEKKPKYLLMENVKALVSKKFMPEFRKWLAELDSYGYTSCWKVLNATDFGVPQNRERVFCVSIRNDINQIFEFPREQELTKTLEDVLEPNVDEKYFLSEKSVMSFLANNEVDPNEFLGEEEDTEGEVQTSWWDIEEDE